MCTGFCHILSDYLFVRCMQRESQSNERAMASGEKDNPVEENPVAPGDVVSEDEDNPVEIPTHLVCAKDCLFG